MNTPKLTQEQIRAAGGIVHSDGNIFFTNIEKLNDALAAIQAQSSVVQQEPVMIYHGDCTIDCGEHGHHHVELLKMLPAGSRLYTRPAQQAKHGFADVWHEGSGAFYRAALLEKLTAKEALADPTEVPQTKPQPLSDDRLKAILFDHAIRKGLLTVHSERMNPHDPDTRCSWLEGHAKACDISNEAAHGIKE